MDDPVSLDHHDLQMLLFTIETSIRVVKRFQFFLWSQGTLQSFLPHDTLVCACGDLDAGRYRTEVFSREVLNESDEARLTDRGSGLVGRLLEDWLRRGREPFEHGADEAGTGVARASPAYLRSLGAPNVLAHGCREAEGGQGTFFVLLSQGRRAPAQGLRFIELLMPHLHVALLRTMAHEQADRTVQAQAPVLSAREIQVLEWVREGKTNQEIGQILDISPLTVKNHIQKILRKLNVNNRAQAVARGALARPGMRVDKAGGGTQ